MENAISVGGLKSPYSGAAITFSNTSEKWDGTTWSIGATTIVANRYAGVGGSGNGAIAAGFGGLLGTILVDLLQLANFSHADAYGTVFIFEAALFALAASIATRSITTAFSGTTQMVGE